MTTAKKTVQSTQISDTLQAEYLDVISKGEDANIANLEFIKSLDDQMKDGLTQDIAKATLKTTAEGVKVGVIVKYGHIPAIPTARKMIDVYFNEMTTTTAPALLTLASRVLADVKASGVAKHLAKYPTLKELADNTKTKAESQAQAKGEQNIDEMEKLAEGITLESLVDAMLAYLKKKNVRTFKTIEQEKLHSLTGALMQIEKNSKVA